MMKLFSTYYIFRILKNNWEFKRCHEFFFLQWREIGLKYVFYDVRVIIFMANSNS